MTVYYSNFKFLGLYPLSQFIQTLNFRNRISFQDISFLYTKMMDKIQEMETYCKDNVLVGWAYCTLRQL